ncbi:MAG: metallophosphoesterase [Bacteroidota bacterium]
MCRRTYTFPLLVFLLSILWSHSWLSAQNTTYFDGPYIAHQGDSLRIQWVASGVPHDTLIASATATHFQEEGLPAVDLQQLDFPTEHAATYTDVERIVAISDVHGQYDLMVELLHASEVIDAAGNWALGENHLIVVGDNMGRGDGVLPILWDLFRLEQQALNAGGRVHLILGNHEIMTLQGDLRYIHQKYRYTAGAFRTPYEQFFQPGTVLGDWLAQHQIAVSINQHLFVHAGIAPEVSDLKLSLVEMNRIFREQIVHQPEDSLLKQPVLRLLYGGDGPLWYRGYFEEEPLAAGKVNRSLKRYGQQKMVVGHTSQSRIHPLYNGKVIAIDCSIKLGETGEVLVIEKERTYTIDQDGNQHAMAAVAPAPTSGSIQQLVMGSVARPQLTITTDFQRLIRNKNSEEYQAADIALTVDEQDFNFTGRVRARGNVRKQVCPFPPLYVDLKKSDLTALGFSKTDKLKLVIPCHKQSNQQTTLLKEHLVYELYQIIEPNSIQTRLLDVTIVMPKETVQLTGFLIETERDYAARTGAEVFKRGRFAASILDRAAFVNTQFFQYMIANCDWSLANRHNLQVVQFSDRARPQVLAYDFDYAGFVGNPYATPAANLPILSVHDRYFFSYSITTTEIDTAIQHFLAHEELFYAHCAAHYLDQRTVQQCEKYLRSFFDLLRKPKKFKRKIGQPRPSS